MKSYHGLVGLIAVVNAELALYPSRGLPDSICTTRPYEQFLALSDYAPATGFCNSRFPLHTYACTTTTSQNTITETWTDTARPTITETDTVRTTVTVATRTARAITICSATTATGLAKRNPPCTKSRPSTLSVSVRPERAAVDASASATMSTSASASASASVVAAATVTPAPTLSAPPARRKKALGRKLATIERWADSGIDGPRRFSAISACRCIQSNPPCTTRTVLLSDRTVTEFPSDNQPVTVTAGATYTLTLPKTAVVTPTVHVTSCSHV